ncbi:hypothetical protein C2G38_562903 [Gigaspora rosea]|uniref:Uncharacterized protein n=1 Tax=Gigaspora rosea TaxID=44941 RepID=A0A397UEY4_9GLOM|nr:hypothetical protein C2G38_562903 [Gigaspora rosea]
MMKNKYFNIAIVYVFLTLLTILPTDCATSNFTYFESGKKSKVPTTPRIFDIKHYNDGTGNIVVQIVRRNISAIIPPGVVEDLNYCFGSVAQRPIRIYPLYNEFILVTYINASDEANYSTYYEWGVIINWSGDALRLELL